MDKRVLKSILDYWRSVNFVDTLAIICMCVALAGAIRYYMKRREGFYFIIYIIGWLLDFTLITYLKKKYVILEQDTTKSILIEEISAVINSVIEYTCFSYFIFKNLYSLNRKAPFLFLGFLFLASALLFFGEIISEFSVNRIRHLSFVISSFEMCLLLIQCLFYYYEIFTKKIQEKLFEKPSFWIISALFIYSVLVIPFFLIVDRFIYTNKTILNIGFTVHLSSFCLLFLALIKAFGMKKPLTG